MSRGLRVLGITPTPTHPTTAGNRARYRALLDRLQDTGATVRLLHVAYEAGDTAAMGTHWRGGLRTVPYTTPEPRHATWNRAARRARKYLGLPLTQRTDADDWFDPTIAQAVREEVMAFKPDAVLMMYLWFSAAIESLPGDVLTVLDAQDVFTDRNERMAKAGVPQNWFSVSRRQEARALDRFDTVLAIQELEAQYYRSIARTRVVTAGHFLPDFPETILPDSPTLLIVGSDNEVNVHGVHWFLREVWPEVLEAQPAARLHIAGRVGAHVSPTRNVVAIGVTSDLSAAYRDASLVVNPLQGGTGLKIKCAEGLAAGRAVVSTRVAAFGLEAAEGRGLIMCDNAVEMTAHIAGLLADRERLATLARRARDFAHEWNATHTAAFDGVFESVNLRSAATSPQLASSR